MQVVVQLSPDVARMFHQSDNLLNILWTSCLKLEPMHLDADDPTLKSYFTVEIQDDATAQHVADRLQQAKGVTAAYVKPLDEPPY